MGHSGGSSPMFVPTDSQKRIIARVLSVEKRIGSKQIGVTKYDLDYNYRYDSDQSKSVSRRTFRDNEQKLLDSYCLKVVSENKRKSQTVRFYQTTPVGLFYLFKFSKITQSMNSYLSQFKTLFSPIGNHWNSKSLLSLYDKKVLLTVLNYSLNLIELEHSTGKWRSQGETLQNQFVFSIRLPTVEDISEIVVKKNFTIAAHNTDYLPDVVKKYEKNQIRFNYSKDVSFFIEDFSALFYINLLRLNFDYTYAHRMFSAITNKPLKSDYTIKEMSEYEESSKSFFDNIQSSTDNLIKMIKHDGTLPSLIVNFITDFENYMKKPDYLSDVISKII